MPSRTVPAVTLMHLVDALVAPGTILDESRARAVGVGGILEDLELDPWIVQAGMAATLADEGLIAAEGLEAKLEAEAAGLARQVLTLPSLETYAGETDGLLSAGHAENLRKLLLAVVRDGRVILIRLAEHLHALRDAKHAPPEQQRRLALTTRMIYAPLANRLGIWQLKWELEDLAFRYLEPDNYRQVAGWLKERRSAREAHLNAAATELSAR